MIKLWLILDNHIIDHFVYDTWEEAQADIDITDDEVELLVAQGHIAYDWNTTLEAEID